MNEIVNPRTGQRMAFVEHTPELLRIDTHNPPSDEHEPEHVHPRQESRCRMVAGTLHWRIAGAERAIGPGEEVVISAGVPHRFWNEGPDEAHALQEFRPALRTREFFEWYFEHGDLPLLQVAVTAPRFADEIRLTRPPWPVQRAVFAALRPLARARGYS
jgi:mannose-6-phosphate isomerase-like protein (cupin superfamily)